MSSSHDLDEVGIIVGEASSTEFTFVSEKESYPPKWEYLLIKSTEFMDGELKPVDVVAQVDRVIAVSDVMTQQLDLKSLERIKYAKLDEIRTLVQAKIIGYVAKQKGTDKGKTATSTVRILLPRRAVAPGEHVYIAPKEVLKDLFSYSQEEGLYIGNLISRPDIPVYLSVQGFRRHVAIIAQTGAGKSYCAGVLVEELLEKGASIIIIDPHADYVLLSMSLTGGKYDYGDRVAVFRNPASTGRYSDKDVGNVKPYEIAFRDLRYDEICDVAGIPQNATNQREAVRTCVESLKQGGKHYLPEDLMMELEGMGKKGKKKKKDRVVELNDEQDASADEEESMSKVLIDGASAAVKYARRLVNMRVFGAQSTPIKHLLDPMHASIVDLSGLEDISMDYIVSKILSDTFTTVEKREYSLPVFLIIEEAHKFVPPRTPGETSTYSSDIINKIAAEGRKFGIFLLIITQRPSKLHPDSLSQCNSQIVMKLTNPRDQSAVEVSSERMSKNLLDDLPGLNPGEAVIVGDLTKAPVMVRVRSRKTREGGADLDVVGMLKEARQEVGAQKSTEDNRRRQIPLKKGEFSEV